MDIGGVDIEYETTLGCTEALDAAGEYALKVWTNGILVQDRGGDPPGVFVYQDAKAKDAWDRKGWTREYGNCMVYITAGDTGFVWCVVDDDEDPAIWPVLKSISEGISPRPEVPCQG